MNDCGSQHSIYFDCVHNPTYNEYRAGTLESGSKSAVGCGTYYVSFVYFISFIMVIAFIFLNLFIAVIL
jgi:hypothetical protein